MAIYCRFTGTGVRGKETLETGIQKLEGLSEPAGGLCRFEAGFLEPL
ncbi:MAG: hypothetical protein JRI41_09905 [Deltaproteobacteria bacterium]|nr:hypothetical protein [Deltaproteobacteria bacterium]